MPLIRYTYPRDVRIHGDKPVLVSDLEAKVIVADRRAVRVEDSELAELPKPELEELAEQVGADVHKRDSKGHFVKAIQDAQGA